MWENLQQPPNEAPTPTNLSVHELIKGTQTETGGSFKKVIGSNPRQVRQQFLQHTIGAQKDEEEKCNPSIKLIRVRYVILKYDDN